MIAYVHGPLVEEVLVIVAREVAKIAETSVRPELNDAARAGIHLAVSRIESMRLDPGIGEILRRAGVTR